MAVNTETSTVERKGTGVGKAHVGTIDIKEGSVVLDGNQLV